MKIVAIIQARMGSTRLPGKILRDLGGETVLSRVLRRVRRMRHVTEIVVATTAKNGDDAVVESARKNAVGTFRGNEEDVLDRYYQAARSFHAEAIVRITADCPLIDPEVSDHVVEEFLRIGPDYASNTLQRTYPRGLDTEVVTFDALERAWKASSEPYQRVHVTPYVYQHPEQFNLLSITAGGDFGHQRWTLDTAEDLEFLRAVYAKLGDRHDFAWRDVLQLMEREPGLMEINREVAQKALHEG